MLIKGDISSDKTSVLIKEYVKLLNNNISASKILVLLASSNLKSEFLNQTYNDLNINLMEKPEVYSFYGLVYNTVYNNWAYLENSINDGNTSILPNLTGLEVSQFILKDILKDIEFKGYNSKKSLLHQLFRRYSLIVQNNLSDADVQWRCENVLKESFSEDAKIALKTLLTKTLHLRGFDYLRQCLIFNHIYKTTDYFKNIEYLIIDDADEMTPICFDFIKYLLPQLKDSFIAYDENGSSRSGYLSADKNIAKKLESVFNTQKKIIHSNKKTVIDAQTIFSNVLENRFDKLKYLEFSSPSKRAEMIDSAVLKIKELIRSGIMPSDIAIITPVIDEMLRFTLKEQIKPGCADILFLSGSEKLIQNPIVLAVINILKLNCELKESLSEFDLRVILQTILQIPIKYCKEILEIFEKDKILTEHEFKLEEYNLKYRKFKNLLTELNNKTVSLSKQALFIYENLIEPSNFSRKELTKFNFFIKQLNDFESIFDKTTLERRKSEIITQIENSIIAENPAQSIQINENDLVIATFQKIIDNKIKTKYQIWLDVSSGEWIKNDTGPLYNAWVFQSDWNKPEYTIEDNINLSRQKTARILRKLILCTSEKIYAYGSLFDSNGVENYGGIEKYLSYEKPSNLKNVKKITPRNDQKPILEYKTGKMAISAVPGAGKTTILLALIIKLLEDGISPEKIYVLTYMDSAARNFRERIKNIYQDTAQLPNISTIHGLALKILKDNSNFEKLGFDSTFEICDDSQKTHILQSLSAKFKLKKKESEDFEKAISIFKFAKYNSPKKLSPKDLEKFVAFFNEYELILKEENLIDYDDMLISAVKLLEENEDILKYYQDNCEYIIEDEAQDSSAIQQRMLELLSAKHKNLVRCGDINQAITATFSNADMEGFRNFVKTNQSVEMSSSQRCCKDVWELANNLITWAEDIPEYKNSFYKIFMQPVQNENPVSKNAIIPVICDNGFVEKNYILKQIKSILTKDPEATIGILLRLNYQVAEWVNFIENAGLKSITGSESLQQKPVFRVIFAILKLIETPFDNETVAQSYEILAESGFYRQRLQTEIRNFETSFIQTSADEIENPYLSEFYWDFNYWLSVSNMSVDELATKIGLYYFGTNIEKSNIYLISTLIKRISMNNNNYNYVIKRLNELASKPKLNGFQFFSQEDESNKDFLKGKVQIMTYHKSKGDEFDYVFLPEFDENNLALEFNKLTLKKSSGFIETVRESNPEYKKKTIEELKKEIISENLRLFYVAITRAKQRLYLTVSKLKKAYGKDKQQEPNIMFSTLLNKYMNSPTFQKEEL